MYKDRYINKKEELINDASVNAKNRAVIKKFLEFEEIRLKRRNNLAEVDERSYKTLNHYISRIKNINLWLKNKTWEDLSKKEIKKLIDDLEDGVIQKKAGGRFEDRSLYYQMFQGKFWGLIKKNHIAREIIEDYSLKGREFNKPVRFIEEEGFRKLVSCAITPEQKCLLWLAWDIGENIGSLLALEKDDFIRQVDPSTNEPEYLVVLSKEKLKRSRTPRSEITNYKETVEYLDIILANLKPTYKQVSNKYLRGKKLSEYYGEERLFKFGMKAADTFFKRAVNKAGVRCLPGGEVPSFKDLRSGMSCCLLAKKGWSIDEVNSRLGHAPNSRVISRYINYLSLDRRKPKAKVYQSNLRELEIQLEKQKETNKLQALRFDNLKHEQELLKEEFNKFMGKSKTELIKMLQDFNKLEEKKIEVKN